MISHRYSTQVPPPSLYPALLGQPIGRPLTGSNMRPVTGSNMNHHSSRHHAAQMNSHQNQMNAAHMNQMNSHHATHVMNSSMNSSFSSASSNSSAGTSPTSGSATAWNLFSGEELISGGLTGLMSTTSFPQNPSLSQEMDRLFVSEPMRPRVDSDSSGESDTFEEDFRLNGVETDLDDLDRILQKSRPTRAEMLGLGVTVNGFTMGERPIQEPGMMSKEALLTLLCRKKKNRKRGVVCVFCRNNGESELIYLSHNLKDSSGCVTCPVLRAYTCPNCGQNGDQAHTIKYCPMAAGEAMNIRSLKTARTATGKRRSPGIPMSPLP